MRNTFITLAAALCYVISSATSAQNLELRSDSGGGSFSSTCYDDCYVDFVPIVGGTAIMLIQGSEVKGATSVDADHADVVQGGNLQEPVDPPEFGVVDRRRTLPGVKDGNPGQWDIRISFSYASSILTNVEVRTDFTPHCILGVDCAGDGDEPGEGDDG